jgi:hypothetical protein
MAGTVESWRIWPCNLCGGWGLLGFKKIIIYFADIYVSTAKWVWVGLQHFLGCPKVT